MERRSNNWTVTRRGARLATLAGLAVSALLAGAGCARPGDAFVAGERATFEAVAPEYLQYVAADPVLDEDERARRRRTVATWELSIQRQEEERAGQ